MSQYQFNEDPQVQASDYPYSPMLGMGLIIWVLIVYLALRQVGHALGVYLAGGSTGGLDLLLVSTQDLIDSKVLLTNFQISLRSLSGMLIPLLSWLGFMLLAPRRGTSAVEALKLLSSVGALGSLVGWILLPLGYRAGQTAASEDVSLFLSASGWNGPLTGGLFFLVFIGCFMLARRQISSIGSLRDLLQGKADDLDFDSNRGFYVGTGGIIILIVAASLILRYLPL